MKRKRFEELAVIPIQKKPMSDISDASRGEPCLLLHVLTQYGLLAAIASSLFPKDLFSLAATSKAIYKAIFTCPKSRANLLKKMACSGQGVQLRNQHHQKSEFFSQFNCKEILQCGTHETGQNIASQPCASCGHTTCDECRVHCVYQSIYQPPDEPDELPNLSGFALLSPHEMGILSHSHMGLNDELEPSVISSFYSEKSRHDTGFLDAPLSSDTYTSPEAISDLLNFDLGLGPLKLSGSSSTSHPSPVIQAFWDVTEARKRLFCSDCFNKARPYSFSTGPKPEQLRCHCTLKAHFLDRWLCLPCYESENEIIAKSYPHHIPTICAACDNSLSYTVSRRLCLWCLGEIMCV